MFSFGETNTSMRASSVTIGNNEFISGDEQKLEKSSLHVTLLCVFRVEGYYHRDIIDRGDKPA